MVAGWIGHDNVVQLWATPFDESSIKWDISGPIRVDPERELVTPFRSQFKGGKVRGLVSELTPSKKGLAAVTPRMHSAAKGVSQELTRERIEAVWLRMLSHHWEPFSRSCGDASDGAAGSLVLPP
ncbi:hypothetical protein NDU88_001901 [Pleurodeles waltl]|uniref:Uncharacterized protein n=1 Tax=Pleurodeles waltl TaxID=8319 RepID=A0AAV7W0L0_PLEWA|nr:hypothetical protein NDU88_001901 [Pleurodeles waltl]